MSIFERLKELSESSRFTGVVMMLLGVMKLLNDLGQPRVEALHGVDVFGLLASGGLLGVGFVGLMGMLNFPNSRKDQSRPHGRSRVREGVRSLHSVPLVSSE